MGREEYKRQHLEFIQGAINRMASNSFQIKGFTVAVVAILGSLYTANREYFCILSALLATILFALIDAYYLQLERKYRQLYDESVKMMDNDSLSLEEIYNMDVSEIKKSYCKALFSRSLCVPYLPILILIAIGWLASCHCL